MLSLDSDDFATVEEIENLSDTPDIDLVDEIFSDSSNHSSSDGHVEPEYIDQPEYIIPSEDEEISQEVSALRSSETRQAYPTVAGSKLTKPPVDFTHVFQTGVRYPSKEELISWTKKTGLDHNIVLVIKRSRGADKPFELTCRRYGTFRPNGRGQLPVGHPNRKYRMETKKDHCPFMVTGIHDPPRGWVLYVNHGLHNHDIPESNKGSAYVRSLTPEEKIVVRNLLLSKTHPKNILSHLRRVNPKNVTKLSQIHAVVNEMRIEGRRNLSRVQSLIERLNTFGYYFVHRKRRQSNALSDLFYAHPTSLKLASLYPNVLVMDATYKTNRYDYPCFQIVGVTATWQNFFVGCAFMSSEKEEHYRWILTVLREVLRYTPQVIVTDRELGLMNAVEYVFPETTHLLCRVHVRSEIENKVRSRSRKKSVATMFYRDCKALFNCQTEVLFNASLRNMHARWGDKWKLMEYLENTWIPHKERISHVWTNRVKHYGQDNTNRVESAHSTLKRFLHSASSDLESAWESFHKVWTIQWSEIEIALGASKIKQYHEIWLDPFFQYLPYRVSKYCLNKLLDIFNTIGSETYQSIHPDTCGCPIRTTHGIPCAHLMEFWKVQGVPIPLSSIDELWRQLDLHEDVRGTDPNDRRTFLGRDFRNFAWNEFSNLTAAQQERIRTAIHQCLAPKQLTNVEDPENIDPRGRLNLRTGHLPTRQNPGTDEYSIQVLASQNSSRGGGTSSKPCDGTNEGSTRRTNGSHESRGRSSGAMSQTFGVPHASYNTAPVRLDFPHKDGFPNVVFVFLVAWHDVTADGHCGYRALAECLGLGENEWAQVRRSLYRELLTHMIDIYMPSLGDDSRAHLISRVNYLRSPAPPQYWFENDCALIAAGAYYAIVVHLSDTGHCCTYLPLRRKQNHPLVPEIELWIHNRQESHYTAVTMEPNSPLPPLDPSWSANSDHSVAHLQDYYEPRFFMWRLGSGSV